MSCARCEQLEAVVHELWRQLAEAKDRQRRMWATGSFDPGPAPLASLLAGEVIEEKAA